MKNHTVAAKRLSAVLIFITAVFSQSYTQTISYAYDQAGNRVSRTIVLESSQAARQQPIDTLELKDAFGFGELRLYPNPTIGQIHVLIPHSEAAQSGYIQIYDIKGQLLLKQDAVLGDNAVNMSEFIPGWYVLRLTQGESSTEFKIIKK